MAEVTKIRQHQWVKIVVTPIDVLPDKEGNPVVFVDPAKQRDTETQARYGCFACNEPLESNYGTECNGRS